MTEIFYKIGSRCINPPDWGDYGDILQHGMANRPKDGDGRLALERTGPFIPPITLPGIGDVVLTSEARKLLEKSSLSGCAFLPVNKTHIVELRWEDWDLSSDVPAEYPETGEPEDYILKRPHDPVIAAALGDLWEVVVPRSATVLRPEGTVRSYKDLTLDLRTWNGMDLIRASGYGSILFTERARDWFWERWGEYVDFDQFPSA